MYAYRIDRFPLAVITALAIFASTPAIAQSVPALYDGKDTTYQITPGSNLRLGDSFTSGIAVTLWQGGTVKGSGTCSQNSCPVVYNSQNLFARRSRLRLGTGVVAPVQSPSGPVISETLRRGDQNDNVRRLQEALNRNGATLTADGNFGRGTKAAVESYQRSKGLDDDGVAGSQTLRSLGLG
jgi:Putative peptidoglycan binding domain